MRQNDQVNTIILEWVLEFKNGSKIDNLIFSTNRIYKYFGQKSKQYHQY